MNSQRLIPANFISWKDYLRLTKPIIVALLLMTALGTMIVASEEWPGMNLFFATLLGGMLILSAAQLWLATHRHFPPLPALRMILSTIRFTCATSANRSS